MRECGFNIVGVVGWAWHSQVTFHGHVVGVAVFDELQGHNFNIIVVVFR